MSRGTGLGQNDYTTQRHPRLLFQESFPLQARICHFSEMMTQKTDILQKPCYSLCKSQGRILQNSLIQGRRRILTFLYSCQVIPSLTRLATRTFTSCTQKKSTERSCSVPLPCHTLTILHSVRCSRMLYGSPTAYVLPRVMQQKIFPPTSEDGLRGPRMTLFF